MAKSSRRPQVTRGQANSLVHTVTGRRPLGATFTPSVRSTLMRTVLGDTAKRKVSPSFSAALKRLSSPTVVTRATGRSSQRRVRSPFLNATMLTPQLTERSMVCARRHIRREVLFAKRGLSGSSPRRRRSKVGC